MNAPFANNILVVFRHFLVDTFHILNKLGLPWPRRLYETRCLLAFLVNILAIKKFVLQ